MLKELAIFPYKLLVWNMKNVIIHGLDKEKRKNRLKLRYSEI